MLFVFGRFREHSLGGANEGNVSLKPGTLPVLQDLLAAIRETGSACRVIVTSRWAFPLPGPAKLYSEGLESLRGADLEENPAVGINSGRGQGRRHHQGTGADTGGGQSALAGMAGPGDSGSSDR